MTRKQDVHVGYRIPTTLLQRLLAYAVRNRITTSEAVRRLLTSALKTSQRG